MSYLRFVNVSRGMSICEASGVMTKMSQASAGELCNTNEWDFAFASLFAYFDHVEMRRCLEGC